ASEARRRKDPTMAIDRGLLAFLEAKPGKGDELAAFLEQGRALAMEEEGTVTWYAFRLSDTTYGIFDTFEGEEGRQPHLNGRIPAALGQVAADLLASDPDIRTTDVIAVKEPPQAGTAGRRRACSVRYDAGTTRVRPRGRTRRRT